MEVMESDWARATKVMLTSSCRTFQFGRQLRSSRASRARGAFSKVDPGDVVES